MPNYPKLAGQNAAYAEQQMKDIKSGARNNGQTAAMKGVMHLVNDEEIKAICRLPVQAEVSVRGRPCRPLTAHQGMLIFSVADNVPGILNNLP